MAGYVWPGWSDVSSVRREEDFAGKDSRYAQVRERILAPTRWTKMATDVGIKMPVYQRTIHPCCVIASRLLVAGVVCLAGGMCSREKTAPPPAAQPGYLKIYSIRKAPDETHSIRIAGPSESIQYHGGRSDRKDPGGAPSVPTTAPSRTVWYREAVPAFDLDDFVYAGTHGGVSSNQLYAEIPVKPKKQDEFGSWTREQVGDWVGIVVDDQLVQVAEIKAEFSRSIVLVTEDEDAARLKEMFEAIKAGGTVSSTSQPSQQRISTQP